jgi:hypothetical protein
MSMHMIRGVQIHGSKRKQNKKPGWKQREAEHRAWLIKMGINPDAKPKKKEFVPYEPKESSFRRETKNYPSRTSDCVPESGTKKESPVYSGDYIVGIATMHKSNIVPVGRGDDPKHFATMRRN